MITQVSCPACQFKMSIPEGDMTKRQVCPNCKSPFMAGASIVEPPVARSPLLSGAAPTYQKTMLGDTSSAIKYDCPRCKAPQEAPSIEAGTKKPCSACGQRLQVPAAPPPALPLPPAPSPHPGLLNKTMLTSDASFPVAPPIRYNCPACKRPLESPASEAGVKKPCSACGQRHQVPAAPPMPMQPNPNKTMLVGDANGPPPIGGQPGYSMPTAPAAAPGAPASAPAAPPGPRIAIGPYTVSARNFAIGALIVVLLLLFIGQAVARNGKQEDAVAAAQLKRDIEKANEELEQKKAKVEEYNTHVSEMLARMAKQDDEIRQNYRELMRGADDQKRREAQDKETADRDRLKRENEENRKKLEDELAKLKVEAEKAAAKQQTIIAQPPPVYYYPPYHWHYYFPW